MNKDIYISFVETEHDPSLTMIYNWKLYWIEFERLSRLKYFEIKEWDNSFIMWKYFDISLKYLLSIIGDYSNHKIIGLFLFSENLNLIENFKFDYEIEKEFYFLNDNKNLELFFSKNNLLEEHHYFHALSSYFASNFKESAILVMDNSWFFWEWCIWWTTFTQSIYKWNLNNIDFLEWTKYLEEEWLYWIWTIYSTISELIWLEPGSIMWLSAYWNKNRFNSINLFLFEEWNVYFSYKWLSFSELSPFIKKIYWITDDELFNRDEDITKTIFADISAHLQSETEKAIEYLWNRAKVLTWSKNICISWWVWLNVLANTILINKCGFEHIFVQSAVWDQSISLGWLYYLYYKIKNNDFNNKIVFSPTIWKIYSDLEIINSIKNYSDFLSCEPINLEKISNYLNENKIIWIYSWSSEFWPRALGNRSILASPLIKNNNLTVNQIKSREYWRPLAPIILEDKIYEYLEDIHKSPYMTLSTNVIDSKKNELKGVIHIDWTVRYQTINNDNWLIFSILNDFYDKSWVPVLINTSLNVKWEPIVETPEEAIKLFLSTDLDFLILWNNFLSKNKKIEDFKFNYDLNLFNISFNEFWKWIYLKIWKYFEKIFFVSYWLKVDFCFIYKDKLSYIFYLWNKKYKINFSILNEENWYYFKYKDIVYNFSWNINNNLELKNILDKINIIIVNNYDKINSLFLTIKNDK